MNANKGKSIHDCILCRRHINIKYWRLFAFIGGRINFWFSENVRGDTSAFKTNFTTGSKIYVAIGTKTQKKTPWRSY